MSDAFIFFCWGLLGGAIIDGWDFVRVVRAHHNRIPPQFKTAGYVIGEIVRLLIGGALSMVVFLAKKISDPLGGVAVGIAAPSIIDRLMASAPKNLGDSNG
jgi:hypothetical protein